MGHETIVLPPNRILQTIRMPALFSLAVGFPGTVDFDQAKLHVTLLESF